MSNLETAFQEEMSAGHSAAWDQNWESAITHYKKALGVLPDQPRALVNLGLAYYELEQFDESLDWYQKAIAISPRDPFPREKTAEIFERIGKLQDFIDSSMKAADLYLKSKDADKAIENWTRVVQLMPEYLSAHSRIALVHERMGRVPQAISKYLAVAGLYQRRGNMDDALKTANHALRLNPRNEEAQQAWDLLKAGSQLPIPKRKEGSSVPLRMARLRQMDVETESSEEVALDTKESPTPINEARQNALTVMAGLLFTLTEEPIDGINKVSDFTRLPTGALEEDLNTLKISVHLSQAIDYQTKSDIESAIEELESAVDEGLDHAAGYFDLGYLYTQSERLESARRILQKTLNDKDFGLAARVLLGRYYAQAGNWLQSAEKFIEALRIADMMVVGADFESQLSQLYEPLVEGIRLESDEEKLENICQTIDEMLDREDYRIYLEEARQQMQESAGTDDLIPLADLLSEAHSGELVEVMGKINALARNGHWRTAMEEAFSALQEAPTYLPLHIRMGDLLIRSDEGAKAIEKFTIVANVYSARGETLRATEMLRRIVSLSPMNLSSRERLIKQLINQGEVNQALDEYINLADVYYRLAELDAARATYEKAFRVAQQSQSNHTWASQILHYMADIDLQRLNWRKAVRVYEQLRTLDPEDTKARSSLIDLNTRLGQESTAIVELDNAISYWQSKVEDKKAIEFVEQLVEEHPAMIIGREKLASLYQQNKMVAKAIEQWDKIGEVYLDGGNKEGAKEAIKSILALNPPNAAQYRTYLNKL